MWRPHCVDYSVHDYHLRHKVFWEGLPSSAALSVLERSITHSMRALAKGQHCGAGALSPPRWGLKDQMGLNKLSWQGLLLTESSSDLSFGGRKNQSTTSISIGRVNFLYSYVLYHFIIKENKESKSKSLLVCHTWYSFRTIAINTTSFLYFCYNLLSKYLDVQ